MAVHVTLNGTFLYNRYELLAWLNETLQTSFTKVEQACTGGCVLTGMADAGTLLTASALLLTWRSPSS